jgi:hypothetical protein
MERRHRLHVLSVPARSGAWQRCAGAAALLLGLVAAPPSGAKVFSTREAALQRAFGTATIERRTVFLTPAQMDSVRQRARAPLEHARVTYWEASQADSLVGRAYLDTDRVRTMDQTLFVVVDPNGQTLHVEVLAFHEPEDYLPARRWFATLVGRTQSPRIRPGDAVDAISGATLSARASCTAVRRCLALDSVLRFEATEATRKGKP